MDVRKERSTKQNLLRLGLITVLMIVTFMVLKRGLSPKELLVTLTQINKGYLALAILMMFVFWAFEAYMVGRLIHHINGGFKSKALAWIAIKTTLVGQYYSNITPFASGGQPVQLFMLNRHKISTSNGTAILVAKFLLFQVTVTLYALILTLFRFNQLMASLALMKTFLLIGLSINTIGLSVILMAAFKPAWLKLIGKGISRLVMAVRKGKSNAISNHIDDFVDEYQLGISKLKNDIGITLQLIGLSILQVTAYFSITFFIYKALGLSGSSMLTIITLQAVLYVCVSFVPIPGTVGASEIGFVTIMAHVFTHNFAQIAMMLWRVISYYFGLVFCGIFTLWISFSEKKPKMSVQKI